MVKSSVLYAWSLWQEFWWLGLAVQACDWLHGGECGVTSEVSFIDTTTCDLQFVGHLDFSCKSPNLEFFTL